MELRQLELFVAVAEELHFGRAARRIHLSQPALSQQIKRLENELGVVLLARTQRRVELTDVGSAFLEGAKKVLDSAARLESDTRLRAAGQLGLVRIGFVGSALVTLIPRIVVAVRDEYPNIELTLSERKSTELLGSIRDRRFDLAFIYESDAAPSGITVEQVTEEKLGAAMPEGHRLTRRRSLELADLAGEPLILFPRALEPDVYDRLVRRCAAVGFVPTVAQEADNLQTILGLVASGMGIAFATEAVMEHLQRAGVNYRPFRAPAPTVGTAMAYLSDNTSEALRSVRDVALRFVSHR